MSDAVKYVLDANVLIEAKRLYYAFDLCPGFWNSLLYHNSNGNLESIDRVGKDLAEGDDLDAWIIAYAKANNATVVTHEVSAPKSTKVKIPDVCDYFDIKHINTFEMLQRLGVVFHREAP